MSEYEKVREILKASNGLIRTSDITSRGIHNRVLSKLMETGVVVRVKRGYYQWVEGAELDEVELLTRLFPEGILCMESALHYYSYIDRTPDRWHIAVSKDSNKSKYRIEYPSVKPYFIEPKYLDIGMTNGSINDVIIRVYDRERCICDLIRYANKLDRELVNQAILAYVRDNHKNISTLAEYAKTLRTYKKLQIWVGVWL